MKASELIKELCEGAFAPEVTCDTIKAGDAQREINKVGVTMFATVDVVRRAKEMGVDMLIVHEPTYYDHMDTDIPKTAVTVAKKQLIEDSGIVIWRYHDNMHFRIADMITEGEMHYLGIKGEIKRTPYSASYVFECDTPITAGELGKIMRDELGIKHLRIAGEENKPSKRLGACFGTPGGVFELLCDESIDIVMTGEACEWKLAEYARDACALGINKTLMVMGHVASERDGMRLLCEKMKKKYPFETVYIECGEVYN